MEVVNAEHGVHLAKGKLFFDGENNILSLIFSRHPRLCGTALALYEGYKSARHQSSSDISPVLASVQL